MRRADMPRVVSDQRCACGCGGFTFYPRQGSTARGWTLDQPLKYLPRHGRCNQTGKIKVAKTKTYRDVSVGGKKEFLHRIRAAKALGRPLPPGAEVHHADGSKDDDAPLVICQDRAYHMLLHQRMRIKAAGGDPNSDLVCTGCRLAKSRGDFVRNRSKASGYSHECKRCMASRTSRRAA